MVLTSSEKRVLHRAALAEVRIAVIKVALIRGGLPPASQAALLTEQLCLRNRYPHHYVDEWFTVNPETWVKELMPCTVEYYKAMFSK